MVLISHRGNTDGKFKSWENEPTYIDKAMRQGFDVEVDMWYRDGILSLGHDRPQYTINQQWLQDRINNLWIHCKNIEAIEYFTTTLRDPYNYFWHEEDTITLTSCKFIWAYPGKQPIKNSIAVMPELYDDDITQCLGICSDYIKKYKK